MQSLTGTLVLFLFLFFSTQVMGQKLRIQNYALFYRWFEMNSVGNNPTTIPELLKDRFSYENSLRTINYNSLYGNSGVQQVHTF